MNAMDAEPHESDMMDNLDLEDVMLPDEMLDPGQRGVSEESGGQEQQHQPQCHTQIHDGIVSTRSEVQPRCEAQDIVYLQEMDIDQDYKLKDCEQNGSFIEDTMTDKVCSVIRNRTMIQRSAREAPMPKLISPLTSETAYIADEVASVTNNSDSGGDIIMVDERSCSLEAQQKFATQRQNRKSRIAEPIPDDSVYIKSEPHNTGKYFPIRETNEVVEEENSEDEGVQRPKLNSQELLARQMTLMARHRKPTNNSNDSIPGSSQSGPGIFTKSLFGNGNGIKPSRLQPQSVPQTQAGGKDASTRDTDSLDPILINDALDDHAEIENLLHHENEDDSWMHNSGSESTEGKELDKLKNKKRELKQKQQRKKGFTEANRFELKRVEGEIELCRQRAKLAERRAEKASEGDNENEMFVSRGEGLDQDMNEMQSGTGRGGTDEEDPSQVRARMYQGTYEDELLARATQEDYYREALMLQERDSPSKGRGGNKKGTKMAKTARQVEERRREREREKVRKRGRDHPNGKQKSIPIRGGSSKVSKKGKQGGKIHKSRMRNRWDNSDEQLQALLDNLINNDIIADRAAQKDYGLAPSIHERVKEKQLQALLACVPVDGYDTHRATAQKNDLKLASKRFGFGMVKAVDGKWRLKGMKTALYHHQLLAADWMVGRELGTREPHGGLLADAMGLGKTLEMLAVMVGNPPSGRYLKSRSRGTLLVLPSSAIHQWEDEIRKHCQGNILPKVFHFRASTKLPINLLKECDVVLTTYAEVMHSFPHPTADDLKKFQKRGGLEKWAKEAQSNCGDLHKIHWYRVVLDEAQAIKNYKSRTSIACQNLKGAFRWALSGTPIQNRLDELFPYFRFLKAPWTTKYEDFRKHFCDSEADDSNARMNVVLSIVMMRRTMADKMLGRPLVELPPIHAKTQFINFSKEERVFYRVLEDRFRDNINHHFAQGTAQKNYATFMVQLLRLRQCTAHPFLLESTVKEVLNLEDLKRLKSELQRLSKNKKPIYEQIEQWKQESEEERTAARGKGEPALAPGEKVPFGKSEFGTYFKMTKFLDELDEDAAMERVVCKLCGDLPQNAQITDCLHIFCEDCLRDYMHRQAAMNEEGEYTECPVCRKLFNEASPYKELSLRDDLDSNEDSQGARNDSQKPNHSKKTKNPDPFMGKSSWLHMCMRDPKKYVLPSAKTIAFKAQVLKWIDEAPQDKIIVFVQFRMMAKIIGLICEAEKWKHVYFTGNMNTDQRHQAVKDFHTDPNIKIMIAGLKVGGQALNLTCANRVISTSLWFNHCVEQQAFGRVFRIGQHKETFVSRFVVKNTVDGRLLDMQADKVKTIDRAMQDTAHGRVDPLSMEDLASLFGCLREDEDGKLHVEADYEPDEDGDELESARDA